jgi:hypothetical protein
LLVGGVEILVLALIFPGEAAAHPHIGEAFTAGGLLNSFLEGVAGSFLIDGGGGRLIEHVA